MEKTQSKKSLSDRLLKFLQLRSTKVNALAAKGGKMTNCNGFSESKRHRNVKAYKRLAVKLRNRKLFKNQNKNKQ